MTELVRGNSLWNVLFNNDDNLNEDTKNKIGIQICQSIEYLQKNMIHGDIKPDNIND